MPAAVQLDSGVFYQPMPGEPPNAGAEFVHNFLAIRNQVAMEVFRERLHAMSPDARYDLRAKLEAERAGLIAQMAANERVETQSASAADTAEKTLAGKRADILIAQIDNSGKLAVERTKQSGEDVRSRRDQETKLIEMQQLTTPAAKELAAKVGRQLSAVEQQIRDADLAGDDIAIADAVQALDQAMADIQAEAQGLSPQEQMALGTDVQRRLSELRLDPALGGEVVTKTAARFRPAPEVPLEDRSPEQFGFYQGPSAEKFGNDLEQSVRAYGLVPAGSDGAPTSTSTRTGTRELARATSPSPGAPRDLPAPAEDRQAPAGGDAPARKDSDPELAAGVRHIDEVLAQLEREGEDPLSRLGGFFDPLPGGRSRGKTPVEDRAPSGDAGKAPRGREARGAAAGAGLIPEPPPEPPEPIRGETAEIVKGGGAAPAGARPDKNRDGLPDPKPSKPAAEEDPMAVSMAALEKLMRGEQLTDEETALLKRKAPKPPTRTGASRTGAGFEP